MWGVLLPPIIGGYYFITRSRFTKYRFEYLDQQRLLFESVLYGLGALIITLLIGFVLPMVCQLDAQIWNSNLGLPEFSLQSVGAGLLMVAAAWYKSRTPQAAEGEIDPQLALAIREVGDELDNILLNAYLNKSSLLITLDSGKVYVVKVHSTPRPRQTKYVEFIPLLSGYRTSKQEVELTTDYIGGAKHHPDAMFRIVIELKDITSLQVWDAEIYEAEFLRKHP